jgi:hypothetical protein
MRVMTNSFLVSVIAIALLAGCGSQSGTNQKRQSEIQEDAERDLLSDPVRALPELIKRLRSAVSARDGFVLVQSPLSLETAVLPANTTWALLCGVGINVHFGSAVAEHDGSTTVADALSVPLAFPLAIISREDCRRVAPAIGKELQLLISGQ